MTRRRMMMRDGRNPYGSKGGYVTTRKPRGDRGMDYARGDMNYTGGRGGQPMRDYGDMRGDYNYDMARQGDMRSDYARQGNYDGHYPQGQGSTYYPIEAMGTFNGYYGMPEQDYAKGGRRDYGYDMTRGGRYGRVRDYGDYDDYGYTYGDYGETLSDEELEHFNKKLLNQLDEREKQMLSKDTIMQKARMMNKSMEGFGEKEFYTTVLMVYTDYKNSIGSSPELAIKLAHDWLSDKDVAVKGAEKLAVYHDCIVEGEDDD